MKLRPWTQDGVRGGWNFYCPGCKRVHTYWCNKALNAKCWEFNGNVESPTFTPSLRLYLPEHVEDGVKVPEKTICHLFVTNGTIQFCGDCVHDLKGQTVPMVDFPEG